MPSKNSDTTISESPTAQSRTEAGGKVTYGYCKNDGTLGIGPRCGIWGQETRIASQGLCFTCYRKKRELANPQLMIKRRAGRANYARRRGLDLKLQRQLDLLERIQTGATIGLKDELTGPQFSIFVRDLNKVIREIANEYNEQRDKNMQFVRKMEKIEAAGEVPIVVPSSDYVSRMGLEEFLDPGVFNDIEKALAEGLLQAPPEFDDVDEG